MLVFLAIVNSTVANANAGVNVYTRTAYAMGRIGAFPYALARLGLRHRAPYVSVLAVTAATILVALTLGFAYDPVTAFAMTAGTVIDEDSPSPFEPSGVSGDGETMCAMSICGASLAVGTR